MTRALDALRNTGIIEQPAGVWQVADPLFAEYLRRRGRPPDARYR